MLGYIILRVTEDGTEKGKTRGSLVPFLLNQVPSPRPGCLFYSTFLKTLI